MFRLISLASLIFLLKKKIKFILALIIFLLFLKISSEATDSLELTNYNYKFKIIFTIYFLQFMGGCFLVFLIYRSFLTSKDIEDKITDPKETSKNDTVERTDKKYKTKSDIILEKLTSEAENDKRNT